MVYTFLPLPRLGLFAGIAVVLFGIFLARQRHFRRPDIEMAANANLMIWLTVLGVAAVIALVAFALAWRL